MTGSLKAKPLHAVPAALLCLMGDQWAVDSANSRAERRIHRKAQETNTNLTRWHMKACGVHGNTMSGSQRKKSNWLTHLSLQMESQTAVQVSI